jgi:hypothetical protein
MLQTRRLPSALKTVVVVLGLSLALLGCSEARTRGGAPDKPTLTPTVMNFKCGFNDTTHKSECTCSGDADCNKMFESGFCKEGGASSCDTGRGTCRCDLK